MIISYRSLPATFVSERFHSTCLALKSPKMKWLSRSSILLSRRLKVVVWCGEYKDEMWIFVLSPSSSEIVHSSNGLVDGVLTDLTGMSRRTRIATPPPERDCGLSTLNMRYVSRKKLVEGLNQVSCRVTMCGLWFSNTALSSRRLVIEHKPRTFQLTTIRLSMKSPRVQMQ